ncbi:hypothetical protein M513_08057, partial [Trichuris suis]
MKGSRKDSSGSALLEAIENADKCLFEAVSYKIIPDEKEEIESALRELSSSASNAAVIITVGGTGFSPRDVTPEATRNVIEKYANGIVIALIAGSLPAGAYSRLVAGVRNNTLIVNFPGSVRAVKECWSILCPLLPHIASLMSNEQFTAEHFDGDPPASHGNLSPTKAGQLVDSKMASCDALRTIYDLIDAVKRHDIFVPVCQAYGYVLKKGIRFEASSLCAGNKCASDVPAGSCKELLEWLPEVARDAQQSEKPQLHTVYHLCEVDGCYKGETKPSSKALCAYGWEWRFKICEQIFRKTAGRHIGHFEIALLRSIGVHQVLVAKKPLIGIISIDSAQEQFASSTMKVELQECKSIMTALLSDHHFKNVDDVGDMSRGVLACLDSAFQKVDYLICICGSSLNDDEMVTSMLARDCGFTTHFDEVVVNEKRLATIRTTVILFLNTLAYSFYVSEGSLKVCYAKSRVVADLPSFASRPNALLML